MAPEWSTTNLMVQAIAGILGALGAASAAHEHRFGFLGHTFVGLIAGAISGYFLQVVVMTTVYGRGDIVMPITPLEAGIYQAVAGAVIGAIAMMVVGFLRYEMASRKK